ncbi:NAD(+) diphosphatase [Staphylococcus chromogenes]|nr:NAD(+) diphosphatase [Staphylococcus chromogenes]
MSILLVTPDYRTLVDDNGNAIWLAMHAVDFDPFETDLMYVPLTSAPAEPAVAPPQEPMFALRRSTEHIENWAREIGARVASIRTLSGDRFVARAVHLLHFRESHKFHPASGEPLMHGGAQACAAAGTVFPRIDPAVIGIVELNGQDKILLARNTRRADYFSLIAGYAGPGETLEHCFAREVLEETGRRISDITYRGSQPWPISGSLMIAFHAFTEDEEPIQKADGELAEIRWVTRAQLHDIPLAAPGSIARKLIDEWGRS